jgi:hypothetical protein
MGDADDRAILRSDEIVIKASFGEQQQHGVASLSEAAGENQPPF